MTDQGDEPRHYLVRFAPEALGHLDRIEAHIAGRGSPMNAAAHVDAIVEACMALNFMPHRGTSHGDIRPGLRTTIYAETTVIAFDIDEGRGEVTIIGVLSTSQDWPRVLSG